MLLMANERTPTSQRDAAGLPAQRIAADIHDGVLRRRRPLDEQLDDRAAHPDFAALAQRDRALVRALVTVVLRRLGTLRHLLGQWLQLPADAPRVETVLLLGAAQILWLEVPDHAAVDLAVRLGRADRRAARYARLGHAPPPRGGRPRGRAIPRRRRHGRARYAAVADGALGEDLRRADRACDRRRQRDGTGARCDREERSRALGQRARRTRAPDRVGARDRAWTDIAAARL